MKIGEKVTIVLEVSEGGSCEECWFYKLTGCIGVEELVDECIAGKRKDEKTVIFKKVEE